MILVFVNGNSFVMFSTYFGSLLWNDHKTRKMEKERNLVIKNSNAAVIKAYPSFRDRKRKLRQMTQS